MILTVLHLFVYIKDIFDDFSRIDKGKLVDEFVYLLQSKQ